MKLNRGSVWPTWYCISSALQCEMLWCIHLACPQQRPLHSIMFLAVLVHCGNHVKDLFLLTLCINHGVFPEFVARAEVCYIIRFASLFLDSNPLIGCFKSISVNMAEIMLPNVASKRILFVKAIWYSSHTQINHLVAVFALSQWNITLCDLVALSLATSLKWVMIINPTGHVQWNHIDLQTRKCILAPS